tara:strand:- start:1862 stop:2362 length:501 start_codon:yes stop_codon:yes gene_type:complete
MNWFVIVLILLAIIGSMMWMMPSPRQRLQALLRQSAMRSGFQVQITRILLPRALGEATADARDCVAYRLPRVRPSGHSRQIPWQVFKLVSHANQGLAEGWSWAKGEGELDPEALEIVAELLRDLPGDVYGLESTPVSASVYWEERGTPETVALIHQLLTRLLAAGI